jgi:hypothetical protein
MEGNVKKFVIPFVFLVLFSGLISGFDQKNCHPDTEKLSLLLGKWKTTVNGEGKVYLFTNKGVFQNKPHVYQFFILKEGEALTSQHDYYLYCLIRDDLYASYLVLYFGNVMSGQTKKVKAITLTRDEMVVTDLDLNKLQIFKKVK